VKVSFDSVSTVDETKTYSYREQYTRTVQCESRGSRLPSCSGRLPAAYRVFALPVRIEPAEESGPEMQKDSLQREAPSSSAE